MSLKVSRPLDMERAFASSLAPSPTFRKVAARVALVDLTDTARALLTECFRQFGIETVALSSHSADRLHKEKFEACVLSLIPLPAGQLVALALAPVQPMALKYLSNIA